jgi:spore germination cell wall hydrolase CwlJ-like protein
MTNITPRGVIERYRHAKERRGVWESHWQFSCWNDNGPNRDKIVTVTKDNRNFQSCLRIARRALAGTLKDPTSGATHYHEKSASPPWAKDRTPPAEIGNHKFYNTVE